MFILLSNMSSLVYYNAQYKISKQLPIYCTQSVINKGEMLINQYFLGWQFVQEITEDQEPPPVLKETFQQYHKIKQNNEREEKEETQYTETTTKRFQNMKKSVQVSSKAKTLSQQIIYPIDPGNQHQDQEDDYYRKIHEQKLYALQYMESRNQEKILKERQEQQIKFDEIKKKYNKLNYTYDFDGSLIIIRQDPPKNALIQSKIEAKITKRKNVIRSISSNESAQRGYIDNPQVRQKTQEKNNFEETRMIQGPIKTQNQLPQNLSNISKVRLLMNDASIKLTKQQFKDMAHATQQVNQKRTLNFGRTINSQNSKSIISQSPLQKNRIDIKTIEPLMIQQPSNKQFGKINILKQNKVEMLLVNDTEESALIQQSIYQQKLPVRSQESINYNPAFQGIANQLPKVRVNQQKLQQKQNNSPRLKRMKTLMNQTTQNLSRVQRSISQY
ncbi:hypothetical protein pb186bvf_008573 [Paramecium bursaria]